MSVTGTCYGVEFMQSLAVEPGIAYTYSCNLTTTVKSVTYITAVHVNLTAVHCGTSTESGAVKVTVFTELNVGLARVFNYLVLNVIISVTYVTVVHLYS